MAAFTHHIFVCCNQRSPDHSRGCCDPDGSASLRAALKAAVGARGLQPYVRANSAGCLDQCEHGPTVAIYPQGIFYGGVKLEDVPRIVDETIVDGVILEDLLIAEACLNNRSCEHITGGKSGGMADEST